MLGSALKDSLGPQGARSATCRPSSGDGPTVQRHSPILPVESNSEFEPAEIAAAKPRAWPPLPHRCRAPAEIDYSNKYADATYEYRHVILTSPAFQKMSKLTSGVMRLLGDCEWRDLGVQQSRGWEHYEFHEREPHILLFRRLLGTDPRSGLPLPDPSKIKAEGANDQQKKVGLGPSIRLGALSSYPDCQELHNEASVQLTMGGERTQCVEKEDGVVKDGDPKEMARRCSYCNIVQPSSRARCRSHGIKEKWYNATCGFCTKVRRTLADKQDKKSIVTSSLKDRCQSELMDAQTALRKEGCSEFLLKNLRDVLGTKSRGQKTGWRSHALFVMQLHRTRSRPHGKVQCTDV